MEQINFTPKQILQKEFKEKMRGYDPADVDAFLDNVIRDYETFNQEINSLKQENSQLRNELTNSQMATRQTQAPVSPMPAPSQAAPQPDVSNAEIMRRLDDLERKVNGQNR